MFRFLVLFTCCVVLCAGYKEAQVCGLNEIYDLCANGGCQKRNCSQVGQPTLCIDPIKCIGGCVCKEGFLRNQNGICVTENKCPRKPSCKENEEWSNCKRYCASELCSSLVIRYNCNTSIPCEKGCVCKNGYLRIYPDSPCIPICQCPEMKYSGGCKPSCRGDPNAVPGCGSNCGRLCSNYKKKNVICTLICKVNGCDCREGYVFDSNLEKCVRPKQCTQVCGLNEIYDLCANGGCQKRNCSQVGQPTLCIDPIKCIGGCVCKEGFLRNQNGICVTVDKCPRKPSCKENEEWSNCKRYCASELCSSLMISYNCNTNIRVPCEKGCVCKNGYFRIYPDSPCIPICQCPEMKYSGDCKQPSCTGENEVYITDCKESCPPELCFSIAAFYDCSNAEPCTKGCACKHGYLRKEMDSPCIPSCKCPQMVNAPHCKAKA